MSIAEELSRLDALRSRGVLSEAEFAQAKARVISGPPPGVASSMAAINRLRRNRSDRWLGGVCGGIAASTGIESWIWRLIMVALAFFGGTGIVLYLLLWVFVPDE